MRILIIDDDYISRVKLKTLMSKYGDCESVPSGELGLTLLESACQEQVPFDVLTLDVDMPTMRGPEVVREIRKLEQKDLLGTGGKGSIKIITITGHQAPKEVFQTVTDGADFVILKPVTPEKLAHAMSTITSVT